MAIPLVFSWSGGKDSAMALHVLLRNPDYEVVSLLTTVTEGYERISMHGVRNELLHRQAESIGLPVEEVRIPQQCPNPVYEARMAEAVLRFREQGVLHFGFGDIFLEDLRVYREQKLMRANMTALFPIWKIDTRELASRFVEDGFRAITACIDPRKLDKSFAGWGTWTLPFSRSSSRCRSLRRKWRIPHLRLRRTYFPLSDSCPGWPDRRARFLCLLLLLPKNEGE